MLTAASEDIKSMSSSYTDFITAQKYKYGSADRMFEPELFTSNKLNLWSAVRDQTPNNLHEELSTIISKNSNSSADDDDMMTLKNLNDSTSSYKPFTSDDLYYGVNLSTNVTMRTYKAKRCSCYLDSSTDSQFQLPPATRPRPASTSFLPSQPLALTTPTTGTAPKFSHRNIRLSREDCENLENEALQVYRKFSYYDTSF